MSSDLDPMFVKALKLLHSKAKDSADQLKQMLDDVLLQKCSSFKDSGEGRGSPGAHSNSSQGSNKSHSSKRDEDGKKKEAEKRNLEKLKQEIADLSNYPEPAKKPKLEISDTHKHSSKDKHADKSRDREKEKEKERDRLWREIIKDHDKDKSSSSKTKDKNKDSPSEEKQTSFLTVTKEKGSNENKEKSLFKELERVKAPTVESESDEETETELDAEDFAVDLGIACIVCKQFDVSSGNQLVECQECHNLYHQECHKPAVLDSEVNDPRSVWYCTRCQKTLKKQVSKPQTKMLKASPVTAKEPPSNKAAKIEPAILQPFKRVEPVKTSSSAAPTRPLMGLASLAANLSGKQPASAKQDSSKSSKPDASKSSKSESSKSAPAMSFGEALMKSSTIPKVDKSGGKSDSSKSLVGATGSSKSGQKQSTSSGQKAPPGTAAVSADKRLQMMKKKAAAKQQDKRIAFR